MKSSQGKLSEKPTKNAFENITEVKLFYSPRVVEEEHMATPIEQSFWSVLFSGRNFGIKLERDEKIVYSTHPHYLKNILILSAFWILLIVAFFLVIPLLVLKNVSNNVKRSDFTLFVFRVIFISILILDFFFAFYFVIYKFMYKKLSIKYILTTERAVIKRGYGSNHISLLRGILEQYGPLGIRSTAEPSSTPNYENYISYYYKEINEIFYIVHQNSSEGNFGSVFFGHEIENYYRLFSIVSKVKSSGFELIPNVEGVLDILLGLCAKVGSQNNHARLIRKESDIALKSRVIAKTNTCCGCFHLIPGLCRAKPPREGKFSYNYLFANNFE